MARALAAQGVSLAFIGPLRTSVQPLARIRQRLGRRLGQSYLIERDGSVLRAYARQVVEQLAHLDVDAVFSPGTIPIAYLETHLPILYWTDATFAAMVDYYPDFSRLGKASLRAGNRMERAAITRADLAFYSSSWAADSAKQAYAGDPAKVHVLPFGANLEREPDRDEVDSLIASRAREECRLLFLGVDWDRKGGDLALALTTELVKRGVPARLIVAGPPAGTVPPSPLIDYVGFVDKSTPSGEAQLGRLLGESHFLCLPSHAEAFGIVFCEASAYGLPSLSVRTGGIGSAVQDGKNGYLFCESEFVPGAADVVAARMEDHDDSYVPLALSSRLEYESRLNWTTSTRILLEHVLRLVSQPR
jgi:glycosyltransferase involved in cell wall biosynthesis